MRTSDPVHNLLAFEVSTLIMTNPLESYISDCCGAEHDINAEHHVLNESIRGGCSACGRYSDFSPAEENVRHNQRISLAALNTYEPDMSDYHLDIL